MKVYFGFALKDAHRQATRYRVVIQLLKKMKHILTNISVANNALQLATYLKQANRIELYRDTMKSIEKADVCIFDVTEKSMGLGQRTMYSLFKKKPTLLLSDRTENGPLMGFFIGGCRSDFIEIRDYTTTQELIEHIKQFLEKHKNPRRARMTLHLERDQSVYLEERAKEDGISKVQALEDILIEYKEYLQNEEETGK